MLKDKIFETDRAETFNDLYHKKNKWVDIKGLEKKLLAQNLFDLVDNAYRSIGGHFEIKSPEDLENFQFIKAEDLDHDPDADTMSMYKKTHSGVKFVGAGQDGSSEAKKDLLDNTAKEMFRKGFYAEVSDKLAEILLNKYHVPYVDNKEEVEQILRKPVKWIGDGWYERNISGVGNHKKILVGRPN